jgi:hypothetical protein
LRSLRYALGLAVSTDVRMQYNILLPPREGVIDDDFEAGENALMFPLYWHHVSSHITESEADRLGMKAVYLLYWVEFTLIPVSVIFTIGMVAGGICLIRRGGWMTENASNRINEAGLRFHKMQADM